MRTIPFTSWGDDGHTITVIERPDTIADMATQMNDAGWSFHVWPASNQLRAHNDEGDSICMENYHRKVEAPHAVDRLVTKAWDAFN